MQSTKQLFSIKVFHEFYHDGFFDDIQITPDSVLATLLDRFGVLQHSDYKGVALYIPSDKDPIAVIAQIKQVLEDPYFVFALRTLDPLVYSCTAEFPIQEQLQMHHSNTFRVPQDGQFVLNNDTNAITSESTFGKVVISLDQLNNDLSGHNPLSYHVKYTARKTIWKYYFINRSNMDLSGLAIETSNPDISFSGPRTDAIPNGEEAMSFTSNVPIALREIPNHQFNLSAINNNARKIVFRGLPAPNPKQMSIEQQQGQQVLVSPMYVYV